MMHLGQGKTRFQEKPAVGARFSGRWTLIHDLSFGIAVVLIVGGALAVYAPGNLTSPPAGWRFLGPAMAGMIAAGILKFILTGRALTPGEAVRDFLFPGLLAASSCHVLLWQAPQNFSGLIQLSPISATVFYLLYHGANAYRLVNSRKHLDTIAGAASRLFPSRWDCRSHCHRINWRVHWATPSRPVCCRVLRLGAWESAGRCCCFCST